MMKTYNSLLVACLLMVGTCLFAQERFDIRFMLEDFDCESGQACYLVQVKAATNETWNLAGQNYRIFYDGSVASYISGSAESRLNADQYSAPLLTSDQQNVDASGFPGDLPFASTLSFLNYSIDLMNLSSGGVDLPGSGEWITTSSLCFQVTGDVIDDASECLNLVWARMGRTDGYATAFVEISQWLAANSTAEAMGMVYDDLDENDNEQACLTFYCEGETNENTPTACSDGEDNDLDGLVDCADDDCAMVMPCAPESNSYDINLALSSVDCGSNMACYNIQLRGAGDMSFMLGNQDYRLFYNSGVGTFTSVVSRLGADYQPVSIMGGTPIENQNAAGVGDLAFEDDLGFIDFSIDLVSQAGGTDQVINVGSYTTTAEICFTMTDEAIMDGDVCFETAWGRNGLTDSYNTGILAIQEWMTVSDVRNLVPSTFNDLSPSSGNSACFDTSCGENMVETGTTMCSDGVDNDGDGLVDCLDPDCSQVTICQENCAAQAPTLSGN